MTNHEALETAKEKITTDRYRAFAMSKGYFFGTIQGATKPLGRGMERNDPDARVLVEMPGQPQKALRKGEITVRLCRLPIDLAPRHNPFFEGVRWALLQRISFTTPHVWGYGSEGEYAHSATSIKELREGDAAALDDYFAQDPDDRDAASMSEQLLVSTTHRLPNFGKGPEEGDEGYDEYQTGIAKVKANHELTVEAFKLDYPGATGLLTVTDEGRLGPAAVADAVAWILEDPYKLPSPIDL